MNVLDYLRRKKLSIYALAKAAGLAYTTLYPHVRHGRPLGLLAAKKLETATNGEITAAEVLGLAAPPPKRKRRSSTRKAA